MRKLALVIGASAGIGYHLAEGPVDRGYEVVIVGASTRTATVAERIGLGVHPVRADLSTRSGVDETRDAVTRLGRPLEVAVLNAGVSLEGAFADSDIDEELRLLASNVTSQVFAGQKRRPAHGGPSDRVDLVHLVAVGAHPHPLRNHLRAHQILHLQLCSGAA